MWTLTDIHLAINENNTFSIENDVQETIRKFLVIVLRASYSKYNSVYYKILANYLAGRECKCISYNWDTMLERTIMKTYDLDPPTFYSDTIRELSANHAHVHNLQNQITVLKPHGSLNWIKNSNQLLEFSDCVPLPQHKQIMILPPTHYKFRYMQESLGLNRILFKDIFTECATALEKADTLIIIGYSFPTFDLEAEYLFRRHGGNIRRVIAFDINPEKIAPRLVSLFPRSKLSFVAGGFQEFQNVKFPEYLDNFIQQ